MKSVAEGAPIKRDSLGGGGRREEE